MNAPKLTKAEIVELKQHLPYGAIKQIAANLELRPDYVSAVLNNLKPYNQKIIKAAIEIVENTVKESREINKRFKKLNQKSTI